MFRKYVLNYTVPGKICYIGVFVGIGNYKRISNGIWDNNDTLNTISSCSNVGLYVTHWKSFESNVKYHCFDDPNFQCYQDRFMLIIILIIQLNVNADFDFRLLMIICF